jgi:hypothetical protein
MFGYELRLESVLWSGDRFQNPKVSEDITLICDCLQSRFLRYIRRGDSSNLLQKQQILKDHTELNNQSSFGVDLVSKNVVQRRYLCVHKPLHVGSFSGSWNAKPLTNTIRCAQEDIPRLSSSHIEQEDNARFLVIDNFVFDRHFEIWKRDVGVVCNRDQTVKVWSAARIGDWNNNFFCAHGKKRRSINLGSVDPRDKAACNIQKLFATHSE